LKRFDDAEESLLTAIDLAPTSTFALVNLSTFYCMDRRDFDQAMDVCARLLSHWPQNELSWNRKGLILHTSDRYQEAVDSYERALKCKADSILIRALTWCNYGLALIHLGRYFDALVALDRSEALRASRMWLLNGRGIIHIRIEQHGKALEFFEDAIHAKPDEATPRLNKAESLTYLERYDEAESILNEALAIEPESVDGWGVRGLLAARRERHDEAMAAFSKAIELKPYHGQAYMELATFLLTLDDAEHACQFAERATSLDAFLARAWKVKAQALRAAGRIEEADEAERRGATLLADQQAQVDAYLARAQA
jgi:tetratricopeptide (TPR) repeat protein